MLSLNDIVWAMGEETWQAEGFGRTSMFQVRTEASGGFIAELLDGRTIVFRPGSSARSSEIPKIEIAYPNQRIIEKVNFEP